MTTYTLVITILFILLLLLIIGYFIERRISSYLKSHYKLATIINAEAGKKKGRLILSIFNADKNKDVWNASENTMQWYSMGRRIEGVIIEKSYDIEGTLFVKFPKFQDLPYDAWLNILYSIKYNKIAVSVDQGFNLIEVYSVPNKRMARLTRSISNRGDSRKALIKQLKDDLKHSDKNHYLSNQDLYDHPEGVWVHINESKSTQTSLRYQLILPEGHIDGLGFSEETFKVFQTFEGKLYPLETKYLGKIGDFYEWDLIDLEPGTAYAGLSYTVDGGKTFLPSSTFYGITKNKKDILPTLDEAQIKKPAEGTPSYKMWTAKASIDHYGERWTRVAQRIIVKKHLEIYDDNLYIKLADADKYFDQFPWIDGQE